MEAVVLPCNRRHPSSQHRLGGSMGRRRPRMRGRPFRSPGRGRAPSCASAVPPPTPGSTSALLTSVQGCASSERRIPPRGARGTASCSRPAFPRGRVEGRGHVAGRGRERAARSSSPTRDRPTLHSGPAPYPSRAKTGLRSSRLAWTGSVRIPGAGQVNEGEAQFFSEGREHAPAEGLVATQGIATAPAT